MMKEIEIENIVLHLSDEGDNVRVKSDNENVILSNQNIDTVSELIKYNFQIVSDHYKLMVNKAKEKFDFKDINWVSIAIVLFYLYMYNSWRSMYRKQENRDLRFIKKDFDHPSTHDLIFNYFKAKYPNDWEEKCSILIGMTIDQLRSYYKSREAFYNK